MRGRRQLVNKRELRISCVDQIKQKQTRQQETKQQTTAGIGTELSRKKKDEHIQWSLMQTAGFRQTTSPSTVIEIYGPNSSDAHSSNEGRLAGRNDAHKRNWVMHRLRCQIVADPARYFFSSSSSSHPPLGILFFPLHFLFGKFLRLLLFW